MNIYLASPYSHDSQTVRETRFQNICHVAGVLMERGYTVFSPIAHSHTISNYIGNPTETDFYLKQDVTFLEKWADEMWIIELDGWEESKGIKKEIDFCVKHDIPIKRYGFDEIMFLKSKTMR